MQPVLKRAYVKGRCGASAVMLNIFKGLRPWLAAQQVLGAPLWGWGARGHRVRVRSFLRSFVPSFLRSFDPSILRSFVRACVRVRAFVRACGRAGSSAPSRPRTRRRSRRPPRPPATPPPIPPPPFPRAPAEPPGRPAASCDVRPFPSLFQSFVFLRLFFFVDSRYLHDRVWEGQVSNHTVSFKPSKPAKPPSLD